MIDLVPISGLSHFRGRPSSCGKEKDLNATGREALVKR
jgi:hypothetical protein